MSLKGLKKYFNDASQVLNLLLQQPQLVYNNLGL